VVTCFFVDTAKNIVEYVEVISQILKPGGRWINLGPLLYHFSDSPSEPSIELSYQQLRAVIASYGFTIEKENITACGYTHTNNSMLRILYNCVFFSAVLSHATTSTPSPTSTVPSASPPSSPALSSSSSSSTSSSKRKKKNDSSAIAD
jgi:carnosine N-methyltransferase